MAFCCNLRRFKMTPLIQSLFLWFLIAVADPNLASPAIVEEGQEHNQYPGKTLTFLTFNIFMLNADVNSRATIDERLSLLADELQASRADIIFIQELWSHQDQKKLIEEMGSRGYLAASKESRSWFPPYFLGNGLLILAKTPIRFVSEPRLSVFKKSIGKDFFTRKGVIGVTAEVPELGQIDLFNSHTSYLPFDVNLNKFDSSKQAVMMSQIKQVAQLMATFESNYKVLAIDNNTNPHLWDQTKAKFDSHSKTPEYSFFTDELSLVDSYDLIQPNCHPACYTWDNERNLQIKRSVRTAGGTYIGGYAPNSRIDYIFISGDGVQGVESDLAMQTPYHLKIKGQAETEELHLSDHFGWKTTVRFPISKR